MTDDELRKIAEFYTEVEMTAGAKNFLKRSSPFYLQSGTQKCALPNGLQYRIKAIVESYYDELKQQQKIL